MARYIDAITDGDCNSRERLNTSYKPTAYKEIFELFHYCRRIGVEAKLKGIMDGYAIRFNNGADFVQHQFSYGSKNGCVEPAGVDDRYDYTAVKLDIAKKLVCKNYKKLNSEE